MWWDIETGSHYAVQTSLRIMVFRPQSLECLDFKCVPPHLAVVTRCLTLLMGQNCSHQGVFVSDSWQTGGQRLYLGYKVWFFQASWMWWIILSVRLIGLQSPWKQIDEHVYTGLIDMEKARPECGWHYDMVRGSGLNEKEKVRRAAASVSPSRLDVTWPATSHFCCPTPATINCTFKLWATHSKPFFFPLAMFLSKQGEK